MAETDPQPQNLQSLGPFIDSSGAWLETHGMYPRVTERGMGDAVGVEGHANPFGMMMCVFDNICFRVTTELCVRVWVRG